MDMMTGGSVKQSCGCAQSCVPGGPASDTFLYSLRMDTSPTALFDSYEQEFWQFIATIREKVETNGTEDANGSGEFAHRQHLLTLTSLILDHRTEKDNME